MLAPFLKQEYRWTNTDFATILIAFRIAYTVGQTVSGRILDRLGTRRGLTLSVAFYSVVASATALAQGMPGFRVCRFLLGAGESANWPGAAKAVAEWFPDRERAWAVALYDSGSSVGGAVAPFLVLYLYQLFGSWRPAFLITGCLGFVWLILWRAFYHAPEKHPRITADELEHIRMGSSAVHDAAAPARIAWSKLLRYRQTWGIVIGRSLLDPYWFLITEWFAIYLVSKGFSIQDSVLGFWVPFLAADLGNFFGGGLSSYWIRRGWPVRKARLDVVLVFGPSMLVLIGAAFASNYFLLIALFAYATFAYAACSTIFLALPADVFHSGSVATVSGMSGTGAGVITLLSTYLIGRVSDQFSFQPIIIVASIVPCLATLVLVSLMRAGRQPDPAGALRPGA